VSQTLSLPRRGSGRLLELRNLLRDLRRVRALTGRGKKHDAS